MTSSVRLSQLYALRAQVDALILGEEAAQPQPLIDPAACPHCGASEDQVKDVSTLDGTRRSKCAVCKTEWVR